MDEIIKGFKPKWSSSQCPLDPDWLTVAYPEQAKLQETLLPDQTTFLSTYKILFKRYFCRQQRFIELNFNRMGAC